MNEPNNLRYSIITHTAAQGEKEVLVESLSPILNVAERKKKIEESLYEIFQKYDNQ